MSILHRGKDACRALRYLSDSTQDDVDEGLFGSCFVRTLDEAYFRSMDDEFFRNRNQDQVVSKEHLR